MRGRNTLNVLIAFVLGATTVLVAKTKLTFDPKAFYAGHDKKEAATLLLAEGEKLAGDDTWERIGVGRVASSVRRQEEGRGVVRSRPRRQRTARTTSTGSRRPTPPPRAGHKAEPLFEQAIAMDAETTAGS